MKRAFSFLTAAAFLTAWLFFQPCPAAAEEARSSIPEKAQCARMMQAGKKSFQAGRYLDAKEYFRRALQADPSSAAAWEHYDLCVIHAVAEKINKKTGLISPDASAAGMQAPPPPPQQGPAKKPKFVIEEDEGC
ncbi:MAG: hypothetical protein B5M55_08565 [Desulfococcus sp. 4484_242]|nr:MAG: hypothetical protein B5M55_08565 [Desulfococcus sp. 4484_242]